eukprot:CFRG1785T1
MATAAQAGLVRPPVFLYGVQGRYANALYSAGSKKGQLDAVDKELIEVKKLVTDNQAFSTFINDASLQRVQKQEGVAAVLKKGGFSELTVDFMDILAANNRLTEAAHIIDGFQTVMRAHRKEVQIIVTTALPLDSSSQNAIKKQLKQFVKEGETLVLATKVDSNLLGGLVVEIGDNRIDMSIASRIKKVTNELRASI